MSWRTKLHKHTKSMEIRQHVCHTVTTETWSLKYYQLSYLWCKHGSQCGHNRTWCHSNIPEIEYSVYSGKTWHFAYSMTIIYIHNNTLILLQVCTHPSLYYTYMQSSILRYRMGHSHAATRSSCRQSISLTLWHTSSGHSINCWLTTMVYRWLYTYSPIFCIEFISKLFHRLPTISSTYGR